MGSNKSCLVKRWYIKAMEKSLVWGKVSIGMALTGKKGSPFTLLDGGRVSATRLLVHAGASEQRKTTLVTRSSFRM